MNDISELVEQIKRLTSEIERFRISTLIELPPLLNGSSKRRPNYFWWDGRTGVTAVDVGDGWHLTGENYYLPIDRRITDSDMEFLRQKTDPPEKMPLYEALYKLDALNRTDAAQANVEAPTIDANLGKMDPIMGPVVGDINDLASLAFLGIEQIAELSNAFLKYIEEYANKQQ